MQRSAAEDQVERRIEERELDGAAFLEEHVRDAGLVQPLGAELEERARQVESDDLPHARRDLLGGVGGTARDVEHDHLRIERFQPRQR